MVNKIMLGKPSGITLKEHTDNVVQEGEYVMACFEKTNQKYIQLTGVELRRRVNAACCFHDDGKKTPVWQNACQADHENYLKWEQQHKGQSFDEYQKQRPDEAGRNLMQAGVRHEIYSLIQNEKNKFSPFVKVAIAAHHSKLSKRHEERWTKISKNKEDWDVGTVLWHYFKQLSGLPELRNFKATVLKFYEFSGVRSYLQIADHRASAKEANASYPSIHAFQYTFNEKWLKRPVQEIAAKYWEDELLILRAPTGAGKTDTALLWAAKQIEHGKAERVVIAMPTRFTSTALAISTASSLSATGLYHSSAWYNRFYKKVKDGSMDNKDAKKEHEAARLLMTPVTVCTIDHLMMAMTLTREDHHTILFNLANSCVVIDEADFYDDFTQANILVLLEFLKQLKVRVMIMSASLPASCLDMYRKSGYQIDVIREDTSDNERPRCAITSKRPYEKVEDLSDLLEQCAVEGKAIIYANTVARAMEFYNWFKAKGIDAILYHSRFTEPDKLEKEKLLIAQLGKEAWQNCVAKGIAILTQIGEMSVNISADIMISELCPIDRLVQRAGRLCRFDKKIGALHVIIPQKKEALYPAPYGIFQQKNGWQPIPALTQTLDLLELKTYSADAFVKLVNIVYAEIKDFSLTSQNNAKELKNLFLYNWVVGAREIPNEDDNDTTSWKSRNIVNNNTVYVTKPEITFFRSWIDFGDFRCEQSLELPRYLVEKGLKLFKIDKVTIKIGSYDKKEVIIYCARQGVYDSKIGLIIDAEADQYM
jgi:CRISPR-associated endonuclease/helicase Cas3